MFKENPKVAYRNKNDITSIEGIPVDAGSLWQLKDNLLILVDDDQYASHQLNDAFVKIH